MSVVILVRPALTAESGWTRAVRREEAARGERKKSCTEFTLTSNPWPAWSSVLPFAC